LHIKNEYKITQCITKDSYQSLYQEIDLIQADSC